MICESMTVAPGCTSRHVVAVFPRGVHEQQCEAPALPLREACRCQQRPVVVQPQVLPQPQHRAAALSAAAPGRITAPSASPLGIPAGSATAKMFA